MFLLILETTEGKSMGIPKEFRNIVLWMHQDIDIILPPDADLAAYLADHAQPRDIPAAIDFVETLLSSNLTTEELDKIWSDACADWYIMDGQIASFLTQLRDRLLAKLSESGAP